MAIKPYSPNTTTDPVKEEPPAAKHSFVNFDNGDPTPLSNRGERRFLRGQLTNIVDLSGQKMVPHVEEFMKGSRAALAGIQQNRENSQRTHELIAQSKALRAKVKPIEVPKLLDVAAQFQKRVGGTLAAATMNGAAEVVDAIDEAVLGTARMVCHSDPILNYHCQMTKDLLADGLVVYVPLVTSMVPDKGKELCSKAFDKTKQFLKADLEQLKDRLNIAQEDRAQFGEDYTKVLRFALPTVLKGTGQITRQAGKILKSTSNQAQETVKKAYHSLNSHEKTLDSVSRLAQKIDPKIIPEFSCEQSWLIDGLDRNFFTVKSTFNPEKAFKEAMGLKLFTGLQLQHFEVPQLLGLGKQGNEYLVVKSRIQGDTFKDLLYQIGQLRLDASERNAALWAVNHAAEKAGKGLGEVHLKSLKANQKFMGDESRIAIYGVVDLVKQISLNTLGDTNEIRPLFDDMLFENKLSSLAEKFQQAPGALSYGVQDISLRQMAASFLNKEASVGWFDFDFVPNTFTRAGKPLALAVKEFFECSNAFVTEGIESRLAEEEIKDLQRSFNQGYHSIYPHRPSPEAHRFFDVVNGLAQVESMVWRMQRGVAFGDQEILKKMVQELNQKLKN